MARSRPCGRSKSDHRVCQAARFAHAAEYRERISISAERQEILIDAVNARSDDIPAPRRRRCQRSKESKHEGQPAREVPARGRCSAADQKAKRQDVRVLREAVNCAAERAWVQAREEMLRKANSSCHECEQEKKGFGSSAPPWSWAGSAARNEPQSKGVWASVPMSQALIATLLNIGGVEPNPGPSPEEIARDWQEAYPKIDPPLLSFLAEKMTTLESWRESTTEHRTTALYLWARLYTGQWSGNWDLFLLGIPAAARGGGGAGAGPSGDVAMPDVEYRRPAGRGQTGADGGLSEDAIERDVLQGDHRRRSDDDLWDERVDEEIRNVLEHAFVSPEGNGQPQLDLRAPPPSNAFARRDVSTVYFRNSPSLLLTNLPGRIEPGLTNAQTLLAENKQLHASGHGQDQVQTRATALIGPSGAGKSRTALEASCHEYGFYLSFSTEKEPGTNILRQAIDRLRETHGQRYGAVEADGSRLREFRDQRLHDMRKFISRILLAYALGLREYLRQHEDKASPKGFLLFQLIGISAQEDWLLKTWGCLLSLSREAVEQKLQATMGELRRLTNQDFFNTFLDEAQVGTRELDGYFPSRDKTEGRPLLNGLVRSLHHSIFAYFHFNLTGTGLSLSHAQQLETAVGEMGAAQLASFTDFTRFTMDGALQYAQEYLQSPPEGVRVHILGGRPRFAAQLVQAVLFGKSWEEALQFVENLHTRRNVPTSLLKGLYEMKPKLSDYLFAQLVEELRCLVLGYYLVGKGVSTDKANVDMIEVGVCHLAHLGRPGECTMVTLVEPLAAMAVTNFLETEAHWRLENQGLGLLRTSPSDAAMGALFERIIPQAQQRFVTRSCLADHPLLEGLVGLPDCFYGPAHVECLLGQGGRSFELRIEDVPRVETWRKGRGLIEFLDEPAGVSAFFPEEGAGPDNASFLSISGERWLAILQAKCRKKVPNKGHALGTLNIRTMYKGDPASVAEGKRKQLTSLLKQRGVKGILRVLLAYPADVKAASYAQSTLRRSDRLQVPEENEFEVVQVCISKSNAGHYLTDAERHHLDCLKDV
ncbi:hypothetical protein KFL_007990030 [Klebsormidium nitens]|uniref:Uncharacterized protein n=1 Tax=Klebsormidium nitens TaxID=105231 RepID=A0A1Y1IS93_KLENI|nr:hypothetical protein KFL_007990030 [Klebsormidium nitens]|eukprot:GAQ91517.1 hypothetical protein KFL_007990030 [Klebsormidium nitens]